MNVVKTLLVANEFNCSRMKNCCKFTPWRWPTLGTQGVWIWLLLNRVGTMCTYQSTKKSSWCKCVLSPLNSTCGSEMILLLRNMFCLQIYSTPKWNVWLLTLPPKASNSSRANLIERTHSWHVTKRVPIIQYLDFESEELANNLILWLLCICF